MRGPGKRVRSFASISQANHPTSLTSASIEAFAEPLKRDAASKTAIGLY
jgi:hypothetical protein